MVAVKIEFTFQAQIRAIKLPFKFDNVFSDVKATLLLSDPIMQLGVLTADFLFAKTAAVTIVLQIRLGHANKHFHFGVCQKTNDQIRFLKASLYVIESLLMVNHTLFSRFGNNQAVRMRAHAVSALHDFLVVLL